MWALALLVCGALGARQEFLLDQGWKFQLGDPKPAACKNPNATFPIDYNGKQCLGLKSTSAMSADECRDACCSDSACAVWQWCEAGSSCSPVLSCWTGTPSAECKAADGWESRGRTPPKPSDCDQPECDPATDDSAWRSLDLPHDFVVEGTFTPDADMAHGYLPFGVGYYRRHFRTSAFDPKSAVRMYLDFEGIQTKSTVWLNGHLLGTHSSGYTPSRYAVEASQLNLEGDNLLAVKADARVPDGWWYDGGGIYRHVWLTVLSSPGPLLAQHGVYVPSAPTSTIVWGASGVPMADAMVTPAIQIENAATSSQTFAVDVSIMNAAGVVVATASEQGQVVASGSAALSLSMALSNASLWHIMEAPNTRPPALYTLRTELSVEGKMVDHSDVRFGIRSAVFKADTGFWLNDINMKIRGNANHQDFAGVGVAVPDSLQAHRVQKLLDMGSNGWRTAHNPPNPALLDATDELGCLVWDENHRNGQDAEMELLIRRDRNHPSVVIWSLCNEVLCNTDAGVEDALRLKALIRKLDPLGNRPVSANQNDWVGPNTPLDLQGFDYATQNYDKWHAEAPHIPSISSETSSAVSDRGEWVNNEKEGYVQAYDNQYPGWGESAEQAWGGINVSNAQGILTRPFISGGWTWTGWDYKGEPTPYQWPDINSHFGILDEAGFEKDRYYWYRSWFKQPDPPELHLFPHWNFDSSFNLPIWAYSNADEVELFVNGISAGRKAMPQYGHVEWNGVTFAAGSIQAVAYTAGKQSGVTFRNTTGPAAALRMSIKDGVGTKMVAGCSDVALVQVEVVDSQGSVVPDGSAVITFSVTGPATLLGTGNGDPASHVNDKSPVRPAYHGKVLAVLGGGDVAGNVVVTAKAAGMSDVTMTIPQGTPAADFKAYWCHTEPSL